MVTVTRIYLDKRLNRIEFPETLDSKLDTELVHFMRADKSFGGNFILWMKICIARVLKLGMQTQKIIWPKENTQRDLT